MDRLTQLCDEAAEARREGRSDEALRIYTEAVQACRRQNDRRVLIRALKGVGHTESDRDNFAAALSAYQEATSLAREANDALLLAHTVRHLGDVLRHLDRVTEAQAQYEEALALYRGHPEPPPLDLANAVRALAVLKDASGATRDALPLWQEANRIYTSLGIKAGVAESKARMARAEGTR